MYHLFDLHSVKFLNIIFIAQFMTILVSTQKGMAELCQSSVFKIVKY